MDSIIKWVIAKKLLISIPYRALKEGVTPPDNYRLVWHNEISRYGFYAPIPFCYLIQFVRKIQWYSWVVFHRSILAVRWVRNRYYRMVRLFDQTFLGYIWYPDYKNPKYCYKKNNK